MQDIEFNLLEEGWIRVRLPDNTIREVSLTEALLHAQDYADLAGEMATQDAAILRLLLAVPLTVFSRVNVQGDPAPLEKSDQALLRWNELWKMGHFPEKPIRDYLEHWHDRFWLFHPERPFWQVPEAAIGTEYGAAKLNGELSESGNKLRLFPLYSGINKNEMTYPQAVRWLLSVNAYDDTSAKPKGKGLPSVGAGWLGKIGYIQAQGRNLFETLMLNLTLLQDGQKLWGENIPCWELEAPRKAERVEIALPDAPAQLLTLQSRRLLLHREKEKVTGFSLLGGDFFQRENAFSEQMTIWRGVRAKKGDPVEYVPCRHDAARQFWREFPTVFCDTAEEIHKPGVVRWVSVLQNKRLRFLNPKQQICFKISCVQYGDKDFFVNDSFSDTLSFQAALLDDLGRVWQTRIVDEIGRCESVAKLMRDFSQNLVRAAGGENERAVESARTQFYFQIDQPFRQWLQSIDTEKDDPDEKVCQWQEKARNIALTLGKQMIQETGNAALIGHRIKIKDGKSERTILYTAPQAYNRFQSGLWRIYPKNEMQGGTE